MKVIENTRFKLRIKATNQIDLPVDISLIDKESNGGLYFIKEASEIRGFTVYRNKKCHRTNGYTVSNGHVEVDAVLVDTQAQRCFELQQEGFSF